MNDLDDFDLDDITEDDLRIPDEDLGSSSESAEAAKPASEEKPVEEGKGDKMSEVRYTKEQLKNDFGIILSNDRDDASRDELLEMIDNNTLFVDASKYRFIDEAFRTKYEVKVAEALEGKDPAAVREFLEKNSEISYRKDRIVRLFEDFEKGRETPPVEPPAGDDPPKDDPPKDDPPTEEPELIELDQEEGEYPAVYYARVMAMLKGVDFEALLADTGDYTPEEGETLKKVTIVKNPDKKNTHVHCSDVNCAVGVFVAMLQDIKDRGEESEFAKKIVFFNGKQIPLKSFAERENGEAELAGVIQTIEKHPEADFKMPEESHEENPPEGGKKSKWQRAKDYMKELFTGVPTDDIEDLEPYDDGEEPPVENWPPRGDDSGRLPYEPEVYSELEETAACFDNLVKTIKQEVADRSHKYIDRLGENPTDEEIEAVMEKARKDIGLEADGTIKDGSPFYRIQQEAVKYDQSVGNIHAMLSEMADYWQQLHDLGEAKAKAERIGADFSAEGFDELNRSYTDTAAELEERFSDFYEEYSDDKLDGIVASKGAFAVLKVTSDILKEREEAREAARAPEEGTPEPEEAPVVTVEVGRHAKGRHEKSDEDMEP